MTDDEARWHADDAAHDSLYDDDWDNEMDEEEAEWEQAVEECGLLPPHLGGGCQLSGTEYCDFECPFRDNPEWLTGEGCDGHAEMP